MKNKKSIIIFSAVLAVLIAFAAVALFSGKQGTEGAKTVTIEIISERDGYRFSKTYKTDLEFLGELIAEEKLAECEASVYGRYIVSAGGISQDEKAGYFWLVKENGEMTPTGIDSTPLLDGATYTLTLSNSFES